MDKTDCTAGIDEEEADEGENIQKTQSLPERNMVAECAVTHTTEMSAMKQVEAGRRDSDRIPISKAVKFYKKLQH